jgi:hypothetical protein
MDLLLPVVGLILGLALLAYAFLGYSGSAVLQSAPGFLQRRGDLLWTAGVVLVGLALLLGIVGYIIATDLRILRILLGIVGLLLLVLAWPKGAPRT